MTEMTEQKAGSIPKLGEMSPDFTANTTHGQIAFHEWKKDKWAILFSHPADFTPVCSTELTEFARRADEFEKRNVKLIGNSVDSIHSHLAWRENLASVLKVKIGYPLIADITMDVSRKYGMIHPGASETAAVRAVFVIDPKHVIRAIVYYPLNVGRNVDEILRLVDALQTADKNAVACPVNWKPGDAVIVPPPKTEKEVQARLELDPGTHEKFDFYLNKKKLN